MSLQIDPDRLSSFIDIHYMNDVEEQIGTLLANELGFATVPIMSRTYGNTPEYDLIADFGEDRVLRIEVKVTKSSWLPVEFCDNGKAKGLSDTKADLWVFLNIGGTNFDNRGTVLSNGSKVEGKINIVKPDILYCYLRDNAESDYVNVKNFDGVEVAYINPRAFSKRIWLGGCEVALRTKSEMAYNSSEIKGFKLETFKKTDGFSIESVLQHTGKFENDDDQDVAFDQSDTLVEIANTHWTSSRDLM